MGKTLKKKPFLGKRSQKRKKPFLGKRSQKRKKPFLGKRSQKRKRKKGKRKSKNYKMRGGQLIIRGNRGNIVPGGNRDTPPPLTARLSYSPWFHKWGSRYGTTSVIVKFRNHGQAGLWEKVHLYGTSMPNQTHGCDGIVGCTAVNPGIGAPYNSSMYRTMGYFMYGKGVNKWISLQACGDIATGGGHEHRMCLLRGGTTDCCQGNPSASIGSVSRNKARAENHTWRTLKNLRFAGGTNRYDANIEMLDILMTDMTVGRFSSWIKINALGNFNNPINSSVFHCLAGWGRTGTVFLFYILRNEIRQGTRYLNLNRPRFGYSSSDIYDKYHTLLGLSLEHHCCHMLNPHVGEPNLPIQVTRAPLNYIKDEVMNLNGRGLFSGNLLISRINTIIVMLWYYIYRCQPNSINIYRPPNWDVVCLHPLSTSPGWVGNPVVSFTKHSIFNQTVHVNMRHFFQHGGLPNDVTFPQPVIPSGRAQRPLYNITNYFGIKF